MSAPSTLSTATHSSSGTAVPMTAPNALTAQNNAMVQRSAVQLPVEILTGEQDIYTSFQVTTNSFKVEWKNMLEQYPNIFKYDIRWGANFSPDSSAKEEILDELTNQLHEALHYVPDSGMPVPGWDDARVFSSIERVPDFQLTYRGSYGEFEVGFQWGQTWPWASIEPQHQKNLAHQQLREPLKALGLKKGKREYYDPQNIVKHQVQGIQKNQRYPALSYMRGYRMSIEYAANYSQTDLWRNDIVFTIDPCFRILHNDNCLELLKKARQRCKDDRGYHREARAILKGSSVMVDYKKSSKTFKIDEIVHKSPAEFDVWDKVSETSMKLTDYIQQKYGHQIAAPNEIGVVSTILKHTVGDKGVEEKEFFPLESCTITGWPKSLRSRKDECRKIAAKCKLDAEGRIALIKSLAEKLSAATANSDSLIQISSGIISATAKLPRPADIVTQDRNGKQKPIKSFQPWEELQRSINNTTMFNLSKLEDQEWAIVCSGKKMTKKMPDLYKAMKTEKFCRNMLGLPIMHDLQVKSSKEPGRLAAAWRKALTDFVNANPQLRALVVILPKEGSELKGKSTQDTVYATVKHLIHVTLGNRGIQTQCIRQENIDHSHVRTGSTRQLMTKMGAFPWKLRFTQKCELGLNKPTMLVGLDVNQDKKTDKSAIGFVSSYDRDFVQYHSQLKFQPVKQDILERNLAKKLMINALRAFFDKNRCYPQQIILYRDGVADTAMDKVMDHEVAGIREAFDEFADEDGFHAPELCFIVIQKRVNTRLILDHDGAMGNCPPGTIVDNYVVSSQNWDWYAIPATAPQNCTATPTRFVVLVDEQQFHLSRDTVLALEAFTKELCTLYFNWPGPVRVPSCVKLADKLSQQYGSFIGPMIDRWEAPGAEYSNTYHYL